MIGTAYTYTTLDMASSGVNDLQNTQVGMSGLNFEVALLLSDGAYDLITLMARFVGASDSGASGPVYLTSSNATLAQQYCPASDAEATRCTVVPPPLTANQPSLLALNTTQFDQDTYPGESNYVAAIENLMQIMLAAVRLDLGNVLSNNVLYNPSVLNSTIARYLPSSDSSNQIEASLWDEFSPDGSFPNGFVGVAPPPSQPATVGVEFLCHYSVPRSPASAFVFTLVATLSQLTTAWAIFMVVATYFAKRNDDRANTCVRHLSDLEASGNMRDEMEHLHKSV